MAAAKVTGVGIATKELPRSANDKARIPTLVVVFNYRNGDDSGESERWVNEEKADDLEKELQIIREYTGKDVSVSEEGLIELCSLKQSDWDKVPIELNKSGDRTYMSIIRVANDFEAKKAMIQKMGLPKKANSSSGATSSSNRPRPTS